MKPKVVLFNYFGIYWQTIALECNRFDSIDSIAGKMLFKESEHYL